MCALLCSGFVRKFDVPINVVDSNGDTIVHHMIRAGDYDAVYAFLESLKSNQRFNCMYFAVIHPNAYDVNDTNPVYAVNDNKDTVVHEIMKRGKSGDHEELLFLMNYARAHSMELPLNVPDKKGNLMLHLMLRAQSDISPPQMRLFLSENVIQEHLSQTTLLAFNEDGESALYLALERDIDRMRLRGYSKMSNDETGADDDEESMVLPLDPNQRSMAERTRMLGSLVELDGIQRVELNDATIINALYCALQTRTGLKNADRIADVTHMSTDEHTDVEVNESGCSFVDEMDNDAAVPYFELLCEIMMSCSISAAAITNELGENPIHIIIRSKVSFQEQQRKLSFLCRRFPEWMSTRNNEGKLPIYYAVAEKDVDSFYSLSRLMLEHELDLKLALRERSTVQRMIEFAFEMLQKDSFVVLKLLLSTFSYDEILVWSKSSVFDNALESRDESLSHYISTHCKCPEALFSKFEAVALDREAHRSEESQDNQSTGTDDVHSDDSDEKGQDRDGMATPPSSALSTSLSLTLSSESDEHEDILDGRAHGRARRHLLARDEGTDEPDDFVEVMYATVVASLSLVDLATDVVVMRELYQAGHAWWSMWMQLMLVAPYLVSHGSLVVLLKKAMAQKKEDLKQFCDVNSWASQFFILLSITPISLLYLFLMDIVFTIFSIVATLCFVSLFVCFCCNAAKAQKFNVRNWVDKHLFEAYLGMSRTEIIGMI